MVSESPAQSLLVVSAHAADFVWRAGGAIASVTSHGGTAHVVCLSYGERGESAALWAIPGATEESVKADRHQSCTDAVELLGASIEFLDVGDYPLRATEAVYDGVVAAMRRVQPTVIATHSSRDPYNLDHSLTFEITMRARMIAQAHGHDRTTKPLGAVQVFQFEPHQTEQCGFKPNCLLDISDVFDLKLKAMSLMEKAQGYMISYYSDLAVRRAVQARRNGGHSGITHAEAFERVFPTVGEALS